MRTLGLAAALMVALCAPGPVAGSEWFLEAGVGAFDAFDGDDEAVQGHLNVHFPAFWKAIGPMAGVSATSDGALYGYAGL